MKKFLQIQNYYPSLKFPEKYNGNKKIISIRSSLELEFVLMLDSNRSVLYWSSEETIIKYKDLLGKWHRYYVDFTMTYINNNNEIYTKHVEVKPYFQTIPPLNSYSIYSKSAWVQNNLKWTAAENFCQEQRSDGKKVKFVIYTEKGFKNYTIYR